jgi:hypothetical protein
VTVLNRLGGTLYDTKEPPPVSVTVPEISILKAPLVDDHGEAERREVADKFAEYRTIRAGVESWQAISTVNTFDAWVKIAKSLQVGRNHVLRATGASAPMGRRYSLAFSKWVKQHHLDGMPSATRSMAIQLGENLEAIILWRSTLSERERVRLAHPQSIVNRWKSATAHGNGKSPTDLRRDANAALTHFRNCLERLPRDQAISLWRLIAAEATVHIS